MRFPDRGAHVLWLLVARRVATAAVLAFVVASATFLLATAAQGDYVTTALGLGAHGDTVAGQRAARGLDRPAWVMYRDWLRGVARLDFGTSLLFERPVTPLVAAGAANTAIVAAAAFLVAVGLGLPLGVLTGSRRGGPIVWIVHAASVLLLSLPPLLAALLLVWAAAVTGFAPVGGMTSAHAAPAGWLPWLADVLHHLPLPALALGLPLAATLERVQSQAIAEALAEPCMTAARARGVSERQVLWRHAVKLGAKPVAAMAGLLGGMLLSGSFAVELVTSWPGLGRLTYDALRARDLYLAAGCVSAAAGFLVVGLLASDLALAALDPRITPRSARPLPPGVTT